MKIKYLLVGSVLIAAASANAQETVIPPERQTVMSQGTEVLDGHDASAVPHYRVDPFWPQPLPNNWILGQVAGIHVAPNDNIWIIHRPLSLSERELGAMQDPPVNDCCFAAPPVVEFDQEGNVVNAWGGPGEGYDWPETEHGIHITEDGHVWIGGNGEQDHQILKFTVDGEFVLQIGSPGENQGSNDTENLGRPANMVVDDGEIYVADGYGNRRIIVFDAESGEYRRHWGAYGKEPHDEPLEPYDPDAEPSQSFRSPVHCVEIADDDLVYVCDRVNNRYQVFQKDGTFVSEAFFKRHTLLNGSVSDLVLTPEQDFIVIVDGVNNEARIVRREADEIVARFGRPGRQAGQFHVVHDITIDGSGNLYTTEVNTGQRIQKFLAVEPD